MKFGTVYSFQDPPGSSIGHRTLYEAALHQISLSETQGYSWVQMTEHHVSDDGYGNALLPMLAAVAVSTDTLQLSTGMLILPLHHPIRVAEEAAVVDIISGGRLTLGVAVGYREVEFQALGSDYRTRGRRFEESLEIMRRAWTGEPFSYRGAVFDIPEVTVTPVPVQKPHPPLWIGGVSDTALRRAIAVGSPLCVGGVAAFEELTEQRDRYLELGGTIERGIVVPRMTVVAESRQEAQRRALPALTAMFGRYKAWGLPMDLASVLSDWRRLDEIVLVGDQAWCAEQLARYDAIGVTDLMLQFALPTLDPTVAVESQARFAELITE